MSNPKVSIMIPSYNRGDYIGKAIESALSQNYPNLEVIVSDNQSTDFTKEIAKRYQSHANFVFFENESNLGRVGNYHKCLYERATGDWVLNLDADDYLIDEDYISFCIERVKFQRGVVLVVGGQRFLESDGNFIERIPTTQPSLLKNGVDFFLQWKMLNIPVPHLASFYNRKVAMQIGFYQHDILSSDWESLRRLCLQGKVLLTNRVAGVWRGHENNDSKTFIPKEHFANLKNILSPYEVAKKNGINPKALDQWRNSALGDYLFYYFNSTLSIGNPKFFREFYKGFKRDYPSAINNFYGRLFTSPKTLGKYMIHFLGGRKLLRFFRRIWREVLLPSN